MGVKNRRFNVAGSTFYDGKCRVGQIVYFSLEPDNPKDPFAIQVLNKNYEIIGYIPKENSEEICKFLSSKKYPHYCAKVKEIWDGELGRVPRVLSHFATTPEELPYELQEWIN
jgi:hypothetical protein